MEVLEDIENLPYVENGNCNAFKTYLNDHQEDLKQDLELKTTTVVESILNVDFASNMTKDDLREIMGLLMTSDVMIQRNRVKQWIFSAPRNIVALGFKRSFGLGAFLYSYMSGHFDSYYAQAIYLAQIVDDLIESSPVYDAYLPRIFKWIMSQEGGRAYTRQGFEKMCERVRYELHPRDHVHNAYLFQATAELSRCIGVTDVVLSAYMKSPEKKMDNDEDTVIYKGIYQLINVNDAAESHTYERSCAYKIFDSVVFEQGHLQSVYRQEHGAV